MARISAQARPVAEVAASWVVRLGSDDPAERAQAEAGFAAWKAQDPRHLAAATRIESLIMQVQGLRGGASADGIGARPAVAALKAAERARLRGKRSRVVRRVGGALAIAAMLCFPAWNATHGYPPTHMLADVHSQGGQWDQQTLSDGSRITLSGASAANLKFDAHQRTVELLRGSVLVDVAKDAARPFDVVTPVGRVRALGTRFSVSYGEGGMVLEMLESRVAVQTLAQRRAGSPEVVTVSAGQRLRLTKDGVKALESIEPKVIENGWQQHQLVVHGQPLSEVLDQIALHHPGAIHFDRAQLSGIRVSGVYPLQNTVQTLELLQRSLPQLRMTFLTDRVVWVRLSDEAVAANPR